MFRNSNSPTVSVTPWRASTRRPVFYKTLPIVSRESVSLWRTERAVQSVRVATIETLAKSQELVDHDVGGFLQAA